ncbi:MAG: orotidine-5'-phosphate decarboxylase [Thiogranum sp.]
MNNATIEDPRVIVALDFSGGDQARQFVDRLEPGSCRLKIGKELFTREGPELVRYFTSSGHEVFLDLKFHDIPNTVARACQAAAALGVWMMNVHASGGSKMMSAARAALDELGVNRPLLIAVTVLTSMDREDLRELGVHADPGEQVLRLATLAKASGLDGVVCSPQEAALLREEFGEDFRLVTPGIRPKGAAMDDQSRVLTPADAIRSGSDYLVMGRPITGAEDPVSVLNHINQELTAAIGGC